MWNVTKFLLNSFFTWEKSENGEAGKRKEDTTAL